MDRRRGRRVHSRGFARQPDGARRRPRPFRCHRLGQGCRGDLALIASADCHYSVARAAGILGIGEESVYALAVDSAGGAIPAEIGGAIERARADGKRPFALVANACSTATGAFDPLRKIAGICQDHGLWLHIDGAHGASALLSHRHRWRLDGVEMADSLTWDAHKLLCTPGLCTALPVRDAAALDTAFHQDASYLFHSKQRPGFDFVHRTVECTKAALGLRLFAVLAALGQNGIADYIDRQFELTDRRTNFCAAFRTWSARLNRRATSSASEWPARTKSNCECATDCWRMGTSTCPRRSWASAGTCASS